MKKIEYFQATQKQLKQKLNDALAKNGYQPVNKKGFLYAAGTVPVLLVAHLDTVHKVLPTNIWISPDGDKWKADEGIGGDDRCGVYAVMKLIRQHHVHVLFCEDEEIGGVGASKFVKSGITPDVKFIIEFDRRGADDAVFYDCDNPEFTDFICSFGFTESWGSFSDISTLAPALGVAAVNLSSGYYNAHTKDEFVVWSELEANIKKVDGLLRGELKKYEYIENEYAGYGVYGGYGGYGGEWWERAYQSFMSDVPSKSNSAKEITVYNNNKGCGYKDLMPFNGVVRDDMGGEIEVHEEDFNVMVAHDGSVYESWNGDHYYLIYGAQAFDSATGMPVRYDKRRAYTVYTEDY